MIDPLSPALGTRQLPMRRKLGKTLITAVILGIGGAEPQLFIDGVTAASTKPEPSPPTVAISAPDGSPSITKDRVQVEEGQTVILDIKVYDPRDTHGLYHDFSLEALPVGTPPGASLAFNQLKGIGRYTWTATAGSAQSYPNTVITFVAKNTFLGGTTKHSVTLAFGAIAAPTFDASVPATQVATVGQKLKFPVIVNSSSPKVKIKARSLPPGAKLSPARKSGTGRWTANLTWKPRAKQAGLSRTTTFTATAKNQGEAQQASMSITFTAASLAIKQAQWNAATSQLTASGTGPKGQPVSLKFSPGGQDLTKVPIVVGADGLWTYTGSIEANNAPCAIEAQAGAEAATLAVGAAPAACVAAPVCAAPTQWYPESASGMAGMCM